MASWGKVTALLRGVLRSPRSLKTFAQYRTVGRGIVASVIGTGVVCYYRYHVNNRTLPFAVYAKEEKVSRHFRKFLSSKFTANEQYRSYVCVPLKYDVS